MRVILLRHGPAESRDENLWPDDGDRPLTKRGREKTKAAVGGIALLEPRVSRILTSPLVRCRQTAEILGNRVKSACGLEDWNDLAPGGSKVALLQGIHRHRDQDAIILVGHEPDLGFLAGLLLFGSGFLPFKKAGACSLTFDREPVAGSGVLEWFLAPQPLRRLAEDREKK
jgi:phosphohistidine phosphatase